MAFARRVVGALMDLGTNSVRLAIARLEEDGSHVILKQEKIPVNLGDGSFKDHVLTKEAMDRTFEALKSMVETAGFFEAEYIRAVATSALRQAENREEFLKRVTKELGLDLKIIPGLEEARLVYRGVANNLSYSPDPALILDIGGGSAELIVKGPESYLELDSLPLGGARVADRFDIAEGNGQVSKEMYKSMVLYVADRVRLFKDKVLGYKLKVCYGCAGTLENLARVQAKRLGRDEKLQKFTPMETKELTDLGLWLGSMPIEERKKVKGLDREKVPIIVAGCAIADSILNELNVETLEAVDYGLKHGLIYDFLDQYRLDGSSTDRENGVRQLGRRCLFDEEHGEAVAKLAVLIYEALVKADLTTFSKKDQELLYYGALIHDIGKFLSYEQHQIHSWYLIKNATLLGFDEDEIDLMAYLALVHRSTSKKRAEEIIGLYQNSELLDYHKYQILGLALETAEVLESRRQGAITAFEIKVHRQKADLGVRVLPGSRLVEEISRLDRVAKKFQTVFNLQLGEVKILKNGD
ncbi:MAG: Ppx/GppA family phosphatase [Deltaproteobacteria bacterium]|jgi:exopolyphosphatase/guanosine-5'-triphosphate,3'-diphosphate pyrophosphatase|nr:Ppx/GppA family phosphatase [Deltaproteobacteria bacterium]